MKHIQEILSSNALVLEARRKTRVWLLMLRAAVMALLTMTTIPVSSFPGIYQIWSDTYPDATVDDALISSIGSPCQLCHVGPSGGEPWNQYGYSILLNGGLFNVPQAFFDVESQDADGEGSSNLIEIMANSLPGWCDDAQPGCENLAWTRAGVSSPATPPTGVTLDPPMTTPPTAHAGGPYVGTQRLRLRFDASQSTDLDGQIVSYHWKFGDGTEGSGVQPVHAYAAEGTYTVHLKVVDNNSLHALATSTVLIAQDQPEQPPIASAGGPYNGVEQEAIVFDGSVSTDLDGLIVAWNWSFGDGTFGTGEMVNHVYSSPGTYAVTLSVTDDQGLSGNDSTTAVISEALGLGEGIYVNICQACHGDPWGTPAVDPTLVAGRRNTGARSCSIHGAINGTLVFPGGLTLMQFLQGAFTNIEIMAVSEYLNSGPPLTGRQRFVTACAGCHGNDASGGPVDEDVRGRDAQRIFDALNEEPAMAFLSCLPDSDVLAIGAYLENLED